MTDLAAATVFAAVLTVGVVRGWAALERRLFPPTPPWPTPQRQLTPGRVIEVTARHVASSR